jgi:hypothetical protein
MPQSRKTPISLIETPYYRCIRRSFLCGTVTATRLHLRDKVMNIADIRNDKAGYV